METFEQAKAYIRAKIKHPFKLS